MATGTVKTIRADKGFGFITPDGGGQDLFFHFSVLQGARLEELREGQAVSYEAGPDPRDPSRQRAVQVHPFDDAS